VSASRYRVVRVEDGAPCLAVQHKDAPAALDMGKTSFEKYVAARGQMRPAWVDAALPR
jgi:hypothetical protein